MNLVKLRPKHGISVKAVKTKWFLVL